MMTFWGFTQPPFAKELRDPDYFLHPQFTELVARLHIMVKTRAFGLVTGEIGSGKSCAVRYVTQQLDVTRTPVVYIAESHLTPFDFYAQVLDAFGVGVPFQRTQARRQFITLMTDLYQHQGKQPLIVIDEAQSLPQTMIQELRFVLLCRVHSYAERGKGGQWQKHLRRQVLGITITIPGRPRACQAGDSVLASRPSAPCGRWLAL